MSQHPQKPWGGRFAEALDRLAEAFNNSLAFDRRLVLEDLEASLAHAEMLERQGILTPEEGARIREGLERIREEVLAGTFPWREAYEDVHMNVEARLIELVGEAGGKLHTARSRNDQVATDLRLWLRRELGEVLQAQAALRRALVAEAERHLGVVLPGYTHLQRAQPILLSHWFLAYYEMLTRDAGRVQDALRRMNESPLGAAALAGTGFPIDRHYTAARLGFTRPMANSIDAVASRDFVLEALSALAIGQVHLSRLAEELVLYSSFEFGFVELPDAFATGSSIMPQKKNPDIPELVRGKAGRVVGSLVALLTAVKGLPLAYNKDLQEDKEPLFDAVDTYKASLRLLAAMLPQLKWRPEVMRRAATSGYALATDLADYLARKGLPFREAHRVVGRMVRELHAQGRELETLTLEELQRYHPLFAADALELLDLEAALKSRASYGGTAPERVAEQIQAAKAALGGEDDGAGGI
ncbi:argininosuccinate lyase [Marinithermus hydrothermalis]|uniref:Argininosuccinate lyase n=1 Tax=Marinithermus hydrothermalis (strain DSM 14884 / JCM 11576 / T1) TaxID=869210 RepID=F2NM57_MARHT|nr:argininosuccinate lyase [Marinithermus hydrothermalis]AEB11527.1 Argininosuccinate lyase [Marinithermus hydrothermalis DSM 14884]